MAKYLYKAKKGPQEIVTGEMEAQTQDTVVNNLTNMGLVPISVVEKGKEVSAGVASAHPAAPVINVRQDLVKLSSKSVNVFTSQLSSLVNAGTPILRALTLITQQTEDAKLQKIVENLVQQIKEGKMLSESMLKYPKVFNNLYVNLVKAGEKSGALAEVLSSLLEYREKEQETQQKIQAALVYPVLTAIVGILTVVFMITFCIPKLLNLFENMHRKLPLSTRMLIDMSNFMTANWYWFVMLIVLFMLIFARAKEGSRKKAIMDYIKLNLPVFNKFIRDTEVAKFSRTLSMLIKNGMSVYSSIDIATDILDNSMLKERLRQVRADISTQGSTLSSSLRKNKALPNYLINMIAVGEEGGKLDHVLKEAASHYEKEVEQGIKVITNLIEPIFILFIGGVVGFIVLSMLLPIFDIGTSIR